MNQIASIDELLNREEDEKVEDLIYEVAKDSVIHLEKVAQEKMDVLISEQMTLRSQLDRLEEYGKYITEQYNELLPNQFLNTCNGINSILSTPARFARMKPPALNQIYQFPHLGRSGRVDLEGLIYTWYLLYLLKTFPKPIL